MELKERTPEARAAYLEGYRAGEDNMQLQVLRILQSYQRATETEDFSLEFRSAIARGTDSVKKQILNIPVLSCVAKVNEGDKREE